MTRTFSTITCAGLILSGMALCAWSSARLLGNPELDVPLNPFGINRSPYGEVLAMAMQGPIDTDFHLAIFGINPEDQSSNKKDDHTRQTGNLLENAIAKMQIGHTARTNPRPPNQALKFFLRRAAENKLRFAYRLDPSHYANYNALHFFLVEGITTHPELASTAASLARETIDYCLTIDDDPRPALTAAAACTNMLLIMFTDHHYGCKKYTIADMTSTLEVLDTCIARYHSIATDWQDDGSWNRISPYRIEECDNRIHFISKIRDTANQTILRLKKEQNSQKQS